MSYRKGSKVWVEEKGEGWVEAEVTESKERAVFVLTSQRKKVQHSILPPFLSLSPHSVRCFEALTDNGLHFSFVYLITFEPTLCVLQVAWIISAAQFNVQAVKRVLMLMLSAASSLAILVPLIQILTVQVTCVICSFYFIL